MSEPRKIKFDVEAIVLAALCALLWVSLLTFDAADNIGPLVAPLDRLFQASQSVYPPNATIQNWCGWGGALIAQMLVEGLGIGAIPLVAGMSVLTLWMFQVQDNFVAPSRQFGWLLVILGFTTLATLLNLRTPQSPAIGPGGYLGALTTTWLNEHFAMIGSVILTLAVMLAGLLLSTDYVVLRWLAWLLAGGAAVAATTASASKRSVSGFNPLAQLLPRMRRSDVEHGLALAGSGAEHVSVRIRGQQVEAKSANASSASNSKPSLTNRTQEAAQASATTSTAANSSAKSPESLMAGVAAAASNLLASKLKSEPAANAASSGKGQSAAANNIVDSEAEDEDEEVEADAQAEHLAEDEQPSEEGDGPRVRRKKKGAAAKKQDDSLEHLDDTSLPEGTEEYVLPGVDLLIESDDINFEDQAIEVRRKAKILEKTFGDFGFNVRVVEIETGPVIAQYEVELEAGLRLSKITSLADDLAIALRVPSVRIVAPIPGKNTVGIEVPNETRQVVRLREVIEEGSAASKKAKIPLFLGKDVSGNALTVDLASLPHLLIAGRTGTGKSVCLNAIIASILMTKRPDEVRMLMIDPKMVELSGYARLPHLMHPVVTDMKKAEAILAWAVDKMEERYALLARAGVRHLVNYNQLGREELLERLKPDSAEEADAIPDHLPFIVIVADEMADLMMTAGKEVEQHIIRLAQKSRAVGIHLILATQKPTVDVITGLIKSNLPARIAFQVASRTDSRVVLDEMGADKLLGNGDMLFLWPGTSTLLRGQGTYLSDDEINRVVDHCSTGEQNFVNELVNLQIKTEGDEDGGGKPTAFKKRDELYEAAVDVVVREGRGSVSLLQRTLGIGYGRGARLIDFMAEDGIVGQYNGSQAREVIISVAQWEAMQAGGSASDAPSAAGAGAPAPRKNRIRRDEGWDNEAATPRLHAPAPTASPGKPNATDEEADWDEQDAEDEDLDEDLQAARYDHLEDEDEQEEYADEDESCEFNEGDDEEDQEDEQESDA